MSLSRVNVNPALPGPQPHGPDALAENPHDAGVVGAPGVVDVAGVRAPVRAPDLDAGPYWGNDAIGPGPYGPFPKPPPPTDLAAPEHRWESAWGDRGNWR